MRIFFLCPHLCYFVLLLFDQERRILQELDQGREEKRAAATAAKDEEHNRVSAAVAGESGGSSMDMFWFLKPCTH